KASATSSAFGVVPVAFVKLQGQGDLANFSLQAGKMTTLIGDEYNFTFQNMNIERGLVWNTEQAFDRGVQVNYANGPLSVSLSWNDGLYTNNLNWMTGVVSLALAPTDIIAVSGGGNLGGHNGSPLNQGSMWNLIYTHTDGPLVISPYVQLIETPNTGPFGFASTEVWSGAVLASYSFDDNWKIGLRGEYEDESGSVAGGQFDVLGFGAGSSAWSVTVTPTYQWKAFFGRLDLSYVGLSDQSFGFSNSGTSSDQFRLMFETGVVF
ncbi:MAG TPA: outer membrane beta-barrel protein, partial [Rhizomicrobium sp.]|nr:outer membrane beta-barrel protein [Rhizomicrobium sp.]